MTKTSKRTSFIFIMIIYLLGIFMGAIDTGIVTPARTVIQNFLNVGDKTGIWMITMYTLAYAASIPVLGKLADKYGRKYIYIISISLFGIGSLFCGLAQLFESFEVLLAARAVQAIGGGGIVPIATAEFGTTFPKEKRGMALGLVGGVYGIANIFGSSAGSAILDLFGKDNWQYIFYINVPITIFIVISGLLVLPNSKAENVKKIDYCGITILTVMILSVLYGLKNIDFFDFSNTITSTKVYPFLIIFLVLLPFFLWAEKKAMDPVMNLSYFRNLRIVITLLLSFITGIILMGMIFVPQFSENALKISSGSGGYLVIILGVFAGVGAPLSGKMIDKLGAKLVLGFGFLVSAVGSLFLILVACEYPNMVTIFISLMLVGLGIGFTMGTPLNYMMLDNTKLEESNSALATVSLIRSIGTAIAPAIMIGFISHAGGNIQANVMALLPTEVAMPELPYAQEISTTFSTMKKDPVMAEKLKGIEIPEFLTMKTMKINMNSTNSKFKLPTELVERMQASNVTIITEDVKAFSSTMFDLMTPELLANAQNGCESGITAMNDAALGLEKGIAGMQQGEAGQKAMLEQFSSIKEKMPSGEVMQASSFGRMKGAGNFSITAMLPEAAKNAMPKEVLTKLESIKSPQELQVKIEELTTSIKEMDNHIAATTTAKAGITDTVTKLTTLKDAVPEAFTTVKKNYLAAIDSLQAPIEAEFQRTLNVGFKQLYLTVTISSVIALLILLFYRKNRSNV